MKITKLLFVSVLVLFFAVSAIGADTIKIGLMAPLTGFAAADGASVQNSVKLAVERVNNDGGILGKKVELIAYDDRADGKEAGHCTVHRDDHDDLLASADRQASDGCGGGV